MLSLYCYSKPQLQSLMSDDHTKTNYNIVGESNRFRTDRMTSTHTAYAMLPLAINGIGVEQLTFILKDKVETPNDALGTLLIRLNEDKLNITRIYTEDVDGVCELLNKDLFIDPPNGVAELYNKCMEQVTAREVLDYQAKTKIRIAKSGHMIIIISNHWDFSQASDYYLTLGLIPVLYKDYAEKFNEEELTYFKELVKRSQVKRINNKNVGDVFDIVLATKKYCDKHDDLLYSTAIEGLVATKINNMRQRLNDCNRSAESALENYSRYKADYYEAQEQLNKLQNNREDEVDMLKVAFKMEGVTKIERSGSSLGIFFTAPLSYYEEEEAELVLNNKDPNNIAIRLLTDIFLKHKYTLHVGAFAYFDFENPRNYRDPGEIAFRLQQEYNVIYNPHIQYFSCLGTYKPELRDAHAKQDIVMFNSIMLAAVKSINFKDGTVINRWITSMTQIWEEQNQNYSYNEFVKIKCLEDTNGKRLSIKDWYERERTENNEETTD